MLVTAFEVSKFCFHYLRIRLEFTVSSYSREWIWLYWFKESLIGCWNSKLNKRMNAIRPCQMTGQKSGFKKPRDAACLRIRHGSWQTENSIPAYFHCLISLFWFLSLFSRNKRSSFPKRGTKSSIRINLLSKWNPSFSLSCVVAGINLKFSS